MSKYKGKKVVVVGFGLSGVAAARYLAKQGARVIVTDLKQKTELAESVSACSDVKIEYDLGKHTSKIFCSADLILVSPGVPLNIQPLEEAREKNIPITSELEIATSLLKEPLIAITGTNGITTTTAMIGEMFHADSKPAFVGGNIGNPLLNYHLQSQRVNVAVVELSSFQLDLSDKFTPAVAVFTNIEEDHLDRYPNFEAYIQSKKKLLRVCDRNSYVILNYDDPIVSRFSQESPGKLIWFTKKDPMEVENVYAENFSGVYYRPSMRQMVSRFHGREETYDLSQYQLFGEHNKENLMAAICVARVMGVTSKAIQATINSFRGVAHRLEFVRKKDGVYFINDSKGTNVMSVKRSLAAFTSNPITLIAGGKDKNSDFTPLVDLVKNRCKIIILLGEAKEKINRAIGDYAETFLVGTFEEAVLLAFQKSRSGDIILLSPGCSSYDMFRNYEERGDYFKKLVQQL